MCLVRPGQVCHFHWGPYKHRVIILFHLPTWTKEAILLTQGWPYDEIKPSRNSGTSDIFAIGCKKEARKATEEQGMLLFCVDYNINLVELSRCYNIK